MLSPCRYMCTEKSADRCPVTWPDTSQADWKLTSTPKKVSQGVRSTQGTQNRADSYPASSNSAPGAGMCTSQHTDICAICSVALSELHFQNHIPLTLTFFLAQTSYLLVQMTRISLQAITHSAIMITFQ